MGTRYQTKSELVNAVVSEHRRLEKNLARLSEEELVRPAVIGEWSVKDLLAHLSAWENRFLSYYAAGINGKVYPSKYPAWATEKVAQALNREIYEQNRDRKLDDVQVDFNTSFLRILTKIGEMSAEELFTPGWYGWTEGRTLAEFVAGVTCNHYYWAKLQIQKNFKSKVSE